MFSCEICEIFKSTYIKEHLRMTASALIPLPPLLLANAFRNLFCYHYCYHQCHFRSVRHSYWFRRYIFYVIIQFKSSRLQMFFKIGLHKNFTILTGKHLYWSLFLLKEVAGFSLSESMRN